MELKHNEKRQALPALSSFNRTSMELKPSLLPLVTVICLPFNRTSMELKHAPKLTVHAEMFTF